MVAPELAPDLAPPQDPEVRRGTSTWLPAVLALVVWLVAVGAALVVRHVGAAHALSVHLQVLPLTLAVPLALGAAVVVGARPVGARTAGVLLGALAGWVSFSVLVALAGTPYGIGGIVGDCGRTVAAAEQYRRHLTSTDWFIKGNPGQYPPLWFWLWGRGAALLGREAYQVQGLFQGLGLGAMVLATGAAWRLVVSWPRAVAVTALTSSLLLFPLAYDPCKGHEMSAALLSLPALLVVHLAVLQALAGGRALGRAAVGGALLGVGFLLYQLFVVFGGLGLAVLWLVLAVRGHRVRALLAHLAVAGAAAFVVVSWYVLPLLAALGGPRDRAPDLSMVLFSLNANPGLPVLGSMAVAVVVVLGALAVAARPAHRLGQALAAVVVAALAVQALALVSVAASGSSFYSYRTVPWLVVTTAAGAVLLTLRPASVLAARVGLTPATVRRMAATGLAITLLATSWTAWRQWHAPTVPVEALADKYRATFGGRGNENPTAKAYLTPLPSCRPVKGLPKQVPPAECIPVAQVQRCLTDTLGKGAHPVLVAFDERFAALYGNYLYLGTNSGSSVPLDRWLERFDVVKRLAAEQDPQQFLHDAQHTRFGPIDAFVLATTKPGTWFWVDQQFRRTEAVFFSPSLFDDPAWHVCQAPPNTVVAVRVGA